jgi:cell division protein FtsW
MLFSTGAFARDSHGDMYFFVKKQGVWLVLGIGAVIVAALVDYRFWVRHWWAFFALAAVLLVLCFIPPIGMRINGSSRWVNLGITTFQPSELAKIASILFLAWWFSKKNVDFNTLVDGFVKPLATLSILMALIVLEVDIGNTALIGGTAVCVLFLAGASIRWLIVLAAGGLGAILAAGLTVSERKGRLMAFLDPEQYKLGEGLQQWQALIAFGSGGLQGLGLGEGRQKMLYLPYAHTDFIFPMIGEELGLIATSLTVFAFLLLFLSGLLVAANASDREGMVLGTTAEYIEVRQSKLAQGQFLPREDWNRGSMVMVIGSKLRAELFPNEPALGFPPGLMQDDPTMETGFFTGLVPLTTIRLPLAGFANVDLSDIAEIALIFDQTPSGTLFLADLEWVRPPAP